MIKTSDRLEYTTPEDRFFDYCLWEYKPLIPYENKYRSVNLLFHSLDAMGIDEKVYELIQAIRDGIGPSNTVWGLKQSGEKIGFEFYFYDYRRRHRERSITKIIDIIDPFIRCPIKVHEHYHYFMFSIDIHNDLFSGTEELDEIHMYIGNPGSTVSSGICYSLTGSGTRLENFYFFFDAKKEREDIIAKVVCSAHVDFTGMDVNRILWPELTNCKFIVVANKQKNDSVYFSGIHIEQLIVFLERMRYPLELQSFVGENRSKLDHLQYDVGFDYRMEGGDLKILKSGYYGNF